MKKSELIDYIKRQLGYPTVNVELTDDQIDDAITSAIDEIKPWYTIFKYLTIDVMSSCIDLSEYNILEVTDVIKVATVGTTDQSSSVDPFSYVGGVYMRYPMYSTYKYSMSRMSNQNIHTVISNYAQMYQEQFYSRLAMMMENRTAGMLYENISWKYYDNKLYIDTGFPSTTIVTIEYITNVKTVEDVEENTRYIRYLQDLSVAFSQIVQARVTGKYIVSGSPTSINYQDMRADAQADIERIRADIRKTANVFYITD